MPYYAKSEDWLHQSSLLLEARPTTTRITTKYALAPALRPPTKTKAAALAALPADQQKPKPPAAAAKPPRGHLVLKTFDPVSGACLKYKTSKAAEVGRLMGMLAGLGRRMAALPEVKADVAMLDAPTAAAVGGGEGGSGRGSRAGTPAPEGKGADAGGAGGGGGGGGGKKKRKGKK